MSSSITNPSSPNPVNAPFAAVVRKPVNRAQSLGFQESDSPEGTELAPIPAAATAAPQPEPNSAPPAVVDTSVPAATSSNTDLEAAKNIPATIYPVQTQDADAQGAPIGASQAPVAQGLGRSANKSWNPRTWSKKQKIWTGVGIAVVLIIIIGAAAGSAAKHGGGGGGGGGGDDGTGGTSGDCDASDPDSICYCDGDSC